MSTLESSSICSHREPFQCLLDWPLEGLSVTVFFVQRTSEQLLTTMIAIPVYILYIHTPYYTSTIVIPVYMLYQYDSYLSRLGSQSHIFSMSQITPLHVLSLSLFPVNITSRSVVARFPRKKKKKLFWQHFNNSSHILTSNYIVPLPWISA